MKRCFDVILALAASFILTLPMLLIALLVKLTSRGPMLHWSRRVGVNNLTFQMPKFRTMLMDTPQVATHLLKRSELYLTPIGRMLRMTSLDELPQLYSILRGELSFVGPRPALFNQDDLIELRTKLGVHRLLPGLTGWAQINGRDDLSIPMKVGYDQYYLRHRSFAFDLKILFLTFFKVARAEGVKH